MAERRPKRKPRVTVTRDERGNPTISGTPEDLIRAFEQARATLRRQRGRRDGG